LSDGPCAAELSAAVRRALAEAPAGPAAGLAVPGALRMLLVDGTALEDVALALPDLLAALGGAGPRRPLVVACAEEGECPPRAELVRLLGPLAPGATFVAHDPDGTHAFRPGRTSGGLPVELDDVLLEAETIVTVGPVRPGGAEGRTGGAGLLFPGLASRRVRELHAATTGADGRERTARERRLDAEEVRARAPVDFQVCWVRSAGGGVRAWAGAGRAAEAAARSALGLAP
jgi:hypothetical protein